jgi:L-aminopeptidase/D-esterase-like protein
MMRLLGALVSAGASEHTLRTGKRRQLEAMKGDDGEEAEPAKRQTPHQFATCILESYVALSNRPVQIATTAGDESKKCDVLHYINIHFFLSQCMLYLALTTF